MEQKKTRKIVKADGTEVEAPVKATAPKQPAAKPAAAAAPEGNATGLRVGAFILWFVGIALEVVGIMILTNKIYIQNNRTVWFIVCLAVDFVAVLIANILWKKSNRIKPISEAQKVKFFLHNNLGLMMSIIAFVPIIIFLLKDKENLNQQTKKFIANLLKDKENLNQQTKKFIAIGLIAALAICSVVGIDFHPVSQESKAAQIAEAEALSIDTVYWTTFGHKYHYDTDCQALKNSDTLYEGTVEQAIQANRTEICKFCQDRHYKAAASAVEAVAEALPEVAEAAGEQATEPVAELQPAA